MIINETPYKQSFDRIYIDEKLFIPATVDGIEYWATDNEGYMPFINKIAVKCVGFFEKNLIGEEIKFINSAPKKYHGYIAKIKNIENNNGYLTFFLDAETFNILSSDTMWY